MERYFEFSSCGSDDVGATPCLAATARARLDRWPDRRESVMDKRVLVSVVDDDESVRESLPDLLKELGYAARTFASAEEFLVSSYVGQTSCLILDVAMPGMSGPDLERELKRQGYAIPIIFITAVGDERMRPRLLQEGAVDCLFKPFGDIALNEALSSALRMN